MGLCACLPLCCTDTPSTKTDTWLPCNASLALHSDRRHRHPAAGSTGEGFLARQLAAGMPTAAARMCCGEFTAGAAVVLQVNYPQSHGYLRVAAAAVRRCPAAAANCPRGERSGCPSLCSSWLSSSNSLNECQSYGTCSRSAVMLNTSVCQPQYQHKCVRLDVWHTPHTRQLIIEAKD